MKYVLKILIAWILTTIGIISYCLYFEEEFFSIYKYIYLFVGILLTGIPSVNYYIYLFNKYTNKEVTKTSKNPCQKE